MRLLHVVDHRLVRAARPDRRHQRAGYETRLYATDINDAIGSLSERVENIKLRENQLDYPSAVAMLVKCSLYAVCPGR